MKYPRKKNQIHKIPKKRNFRLARKSLGPTKYQREKMSDPREKISNPRNIHEKKFRTNDGTVVRWHKTHGI